MNLSELIEKRNQKLSDKRRETLKEEYEEKVNKIVYIARDGEHDYIFFDGFKVSLPEDDNGSLCNRLNQIKTEYVNAKLKNIGK